jgi:hypothetical protein
MILTLVPPPEAMAASLAALISENNNEICRKLAVMEAMEHLVKETDASNSAETSARHDVQLVAAAKLARHFALQAKQLREENDTLADKLATLKSGARAVREKFAVDISRILTESKDMVDSKAVLKGLKKEVRDQKKQNKLYKKKEKDILDEVETLKHKVEELQEEAKRKEKKRNEDEAAAAAALEAERKRVSGSEAAIAADKQAVNDVDSFFSELSMSPGASASAAVPPPAPSSPKEKAAASSSGAEEEEEEEKEKKPCCFLSDLEDTELLEILTCLDTAEVLAAAQANRFVFTRVDELFSLESKIAQPHWKVRGGGDAVNGEGSDETKEQQQGEAVAAGAASIEGDQQKEVGAATADTAEAAPQPNAVQNFFSSLTSSITNQINTSGGGALEGVDPELCILPPPVLDLLRSKLAPAEMRAILNLNEVAEANIKKVEETLVEKEDLVQRLNNTETVRDFLITKLKSAEKALKSSIKEISSCRKQSAADGEVIHFLDSKNIEQESLIKELEMKRQGLQTAFDLYQSTHSHNERQLTDELVALRASQMQSDLSHKAEKKLLVKEIKSLRTSLESVTSERNIYGAQVKAVTQSLSLGNNNSNSSISGGGNGRSRGGR